MQCLLLGDVAIGLYNPLLLWFPNIDVIPEVRKNSKTPPCDLRLQVFCAVRSVHIMGVSQVSYKNGGKLKRNIFFCRVSERNFGLKSSIRYDTIQLNLKVSR